MTDTAVAERSARLRDGRTATILRPARDHPRARVRRRPHHPDGLPTDRRQGLPQRHHHFGPGAAIPEHFHNCDESVLILRGSAVAHIDGHTYRVGTGDTSFIPAGIPHYFQNASDTEELHIFWTYASIHADRTIVATGITTRIDEEHGTNIV